MKRKTKTRKNRYGASSVFLGIILSAVILIECTFLTFVWELDYATKVNNAVDAQVESIICEYNRQLLMFTGICFFLGFCIDDDVYRKALADMRLTQKVPSPDLGGYKKIDSKSSA